MHMFVRHYMRLEFSRDSEESYEEKRTRTSGVVVKCNMSIERHASKIYTRAMLDQFGELVYKANAYRIEEVEKLKLYKAVHTQAERWEKWARGVYDEKILDDGDKFECECGLFEHMGMPCSHMLKVMDIFGYTEIPQQLIVKRWTRDARDILPAHLQIYQRDHVGSRIMTHRHTALYVHAMELVRLGDACVESYQKGMQIIKDGIASLSEFKDRRDGLGLEDRPTITLSAIPDPQEEMREVVCAEQGAQVETLASLGAPEKKRNAGRPTNSREKAPYEELSKQTRFCSICRGKCHKKTTCPENGDLPK